MVRVRSINFTQLFSYNKITSAKRRKITKNINRFNQNTNIVYTITQNNQFKSYFYSGKKKITLNALKLNST